MMQLFSGKEYLQIDVANSFGLDKKDWCERLAWFKANEHQLEDLLNQAEEPALYYAGVQAWRATQQGIPTGYPISLDATASGLQILACLTGDRKAAELCNVVDTGKREDAYTVVFTKLKEMVGAAFHIERDLTKQAILTSLYGSTAIPKDVFGEGKLYDTFHKCMGQVAPAAWELNQAFLDMWDDTALSYSWVLPDNFHVHAKVMATAEETLHFCNVPHTIRYKVNAPTATGRSLCANVTHSVDGMIVREMTRRCSYDPARIAEVERILFTVWDAPEVFTMTDDDRLLIELWNLYLDTNYLSARILDVINENNVFLIDRTVVSALIESLPPKPFTVISVHDAFRVLPNYGNDLRIQYANQLALLAESELLTHIVSSIIGQTFKVGKLDYNLGADIRQANYPLS